jgi:hypothetical protein
LLEFWDGGSGFTLNSPQKEHSFAVFLNKKTARLSLTSKSKGDFLQNSGVDLLTGTNFAGMSVSDSIGRERINLGTQADHTAFTLFDEAKVPRTTIGSSSLISTKTEIVERRPVSSIVLFDKEGKVLWSAP